MPYKQFSPATCSKCGKEFLANKRQLEGLRFYCSYECYHVGPRIAETERFWKRVNKTPNCWLWTGAKSAKGYGMWGHPKFRITSRFSWYIHFGDPGKRFVLHKCDNPACVRPDHLFLGTNLDNIRDMVRKRRRASMKLQEEDIPRIRELRKAGMTSTAIAKMYGISQPAVSQIVNRKTWAFVQ
jgi:hypothetical protein